MIYLRTGLPGSGKTLRTIWEGMQAVQAGREVYALNVNALDYEFTGIKPAPIEDLADWQSLPAGSVLIVDEVQRYLPPMASNVKMPDWVEAFTRNRHAGIDLHFVTQHPRLINYYVRELVNYHEHLTRMEGNMQAARVYYGEGLLDLTRKGPPRDAAFKLWRYPSEVYGVYKSAEVHTVKRYIPQRVKIAAALALVLVLAILVAWSAMGSITGHPGQDTDTPAAVSPAAAPAPAPIASRVLDPIPREPDRGRPSITTAAEYAAAHLPLIEGLPWSAPAFLGRDVTAEPEIYCGMTSDRCLCMSEQGTRIYLKPASCRTIAREGIYNPYRRPRQATGAVSGERSALSISSIKSGAR